MALDEISSQLCKSLNDEFLAWIFHILTLIYPTFTRVWIWICIQKTNPDPQSCYTDPI